jgi:hypothetical protein
LESLGIADNQRFGRVRIEEHRPDPLGLVEAGRRSGSQDGFRGEPWMPRCVAQQGSNIA